MNYTKVLFNANEDISLIASLKELDSRAKLNPSLLPILKLLIPITSPFLLINGPPEFPGFNALNVVNGAGTYSIDYALSLKIDEFYKTTVLRDLRKFVER